MRRIKIKFWLFLSVISFIVILLTMLLSSPIDKIGFVILFFAGFFALLVSLGHLLIYLRRGQLGPKTHGRIAIISIFIILLVMFRSAQTLNWVDALILLLVIGGLLFYSSRRTT